MSTEQIKKTDVPVESGGNGTAYRGSGGNGAGLGGGTIPGDGTGSRSRGKLAAGLLAVFVLIPAAMFAAPRLGGRGYYIAGVLIILLSMVPFFAQFERRRPEAREMVMIAVMCAIAVVSRAAFIMLPQVKPVIGIIIIAGMAFGPGGGFLTGSLTAFVSNFIFGQGLWTPWQMFAYGIAGFIAGLLARRGLITAEKKMQVTIFSGLLIMLVTGPLLDLCTVFTMSSAVDASSVLSVMAAGVPFNAVLAVSTMATVFILCRPMLEKLDRIKKKYGIMEADGVS